MADIPSPSQARILIIDDEKPVLEVLRAMVEALGYVPTTTQWAKEGRRLFAKLQPEIVMIDINLADGSGIRLLEELHLVSPTTAYIIISGDARVDNPVEALRAGADGYLVKPITMAALRGEIQRVSRKQRQIIARLEDKAVLQQELENRTRQLLVESGVSAAVQRGLIMALCRLAEFRDHETGTHLHRMANYSKAIAEGLSRHPDFSNQVNDLFIRRLFATAPLHDIGKAGIPDHILLKRGPLNDEERAVMQRHPIIGTQTLETVSKEVRGEAGGQVRMGMEICTYHHEKWNGKGYPYGLAGEDIPLSARIVALADFYDAVSSPRVYRPYAFPHEKVCEMILAEKGEHFDPQIVDAFFEVEDEILRIREAGKDNLDITSFESNEANEANSTPVTPPSEVPRL
ncbi:MAG: response regulator [Candidatus Sumerlaeia bacterium]|nr:response regulator [Candidatus Sumerlaeia bacterium]